MKKNIILFLIIIFQLYTCYAGSLPTVNILTWWGYLDYSEIVIPIEKKCKVKISFDEYYSNDEFLDRWHQYKDNYQIIIFSNTIYHAVEKEIKNFNSDLWKVTKSYNPIIQKKYKENNYPPNTVYFIHALTGFLWNPEVVTLSKKDTIYSIFKKANGNIVVIPDDPVEAGKLISLATNPIENTKTKNILNEEKFSKIIQSAKIYITNEYSKIYSDPSFAFSFTWSGEAVVDIQNSQKNYEFLIHPQLSYISSDLITELSQKRYVSCVAKELAGEKTLNILQNKDYYFSSFLDTQELENAIFKKIYESFIKNLPYLQWIDTPTKEDIEKYNVAWGLIRLRQENGN